MNSVHQSVRPVFPKGIILGSAISACNMVGLSTLNALLVLYATHQLHISVKQAYVIYAAFGALYYCTALLGGYLGDRYDYKLAIFLGGILTSIGGFLLIVPSIAYLLAGLAFFIMGCSLIVPNLYCLLGKLYAKDDQNRESGFTIVYALTNLGGAVAAFAVGFIAEKYSFATAFFATACVLIIAFLLFALGHHRFDFYSDAKTPVYKSQINLHNILYTAGSIALAVPLLVLLLHYAKISNILMLILGAVTFIALIILSSKEKKQIRIKFLLFLTFLVIGIAFWSLYMLAPSALVIFIQHNVNRQIGSVTIPTGSMYGLNPLFVLIFGPIVSFCLVWLTKRHIKISLPAKFSIGIVSMGIGYLLLAFGILSANSLGYTLIWWVVLSYFFQSSGELFIAPTSYAMVGTLCPAHLEGLMMGVFRLSIGVSGAFSGFLAAATIPKTQNITSPLASNHVFLHAFMLYGGITLGIGIAVLLFAPWFKKMGQSAK
ncbi:MAG: oligopeptide:H+ symporter [Pseudomonadota bacterium]